MKKRKIRGYIHKECIKKIQIKDSPNLDSDNFWCPQRGIIVFDKKWNNGNDIEVIIEIPSKYINEDI